MRSWPDEPFLAGSWAVVRRPDEIYAVDCDAGESVSLRGAVCDADFARAEMTLRQLGRLQTEVARLSEALALCAWEPLTYRTLLGRGGWEIVFLELTGQCNERCRHCYAESSPERQEQLTWEEVEAVVRVTHALGVRRLQLTGGDPLVSKNCLPAARLATELGVPEVEIYTNGLALTESMADDLCALGTSFAMSFYSHKPDVHDLVTGTPGSQRRTLAAIGRVLARGNALRVSLISTADNRDDIAETIELLESVGVQRSQMGLDEERGVGRGTFEDGGERIPHGLLDEGGPRAHGARGGGGKLCVSYRGEFFPCIFSRGQRLGSIRETSLDRWLRTPLTLAAARSRLELAEAHTRLTCGDCRATESVLHQLVATSAVS